MLTIKKAAEQSGLSKSLLYELCRLGRLKHYRVGAKGKGRILVSETDLNDLLSRSRVEGPRATSEDGDEEGLTFLA